MSMLSQNVINPEKRGKIEGRVFHLFYLDLNTSVLFDRDLTTPITWGPKSVVIGHLKKIDELMVGAKPETKVVIISYVLGQDGYRRIQTFNAPINQIGKYLIRY